MEKPNAEFFWFTNDEMSNDFYHDKEAWTFGYVSGSSLGEIHNSCPAKWKFDQREKTAALEFGTQSHTNFESSDLFSKTYRRAPSVDDFKEAITSQAAFAAKLKSFGLTGTSNKQYPELCKIYADCGEELNVMWIIDMIAQSQAAADGVELVKAEDYDACVRMREVLEAIPEHNACMNSPTAQHELSIFGKIQGVCVKVRLDHADTVSDRELIAKWGYDPDEHPEVVVITDYKTTMSANPTEFPRLASNLGYYLKMALQRDLFVKVFNETRPVIVRLLAQEKKEPFLPLAYRMSDRQLALGRKQYMSVIHTFSICSSSDVWPSYENGEPEIELETPEWIKKQNPDIFGGN